MKLPIDSVIFAWYEMNGPEQEKLRAAIAGKLDSLAAEGFPVYSEARRLLSQGPRSDNPIDRIKLNAFVERYNFGVNYFDLTGLPKEELILISAVLLANGVKNIRIFQVITLPPRLLHQYQKEGVEQDYNWLNVYEIADEYLGFFERREGSRLSLALFIALGLASIAAAWLSLSRMIKITDLPIYFFSLVGSVFSIVLPIIYWIKIKKDLNRRLWRRRLGGS